MTTHTKEALLEELAKGDSMRGWGAVLALGRDAVNHALQAHFVEQFDQRGGLPIIEGEYFIDPVARTEKVAFENLTLGPPQLSFKGASSASTQVRVSMELLTGHCVSSTIMSAHVEQFRRSHVLEMGMGYQFEVYGHLKVQPHPYLDKYQVVLDITGASEATCTLGGTSIAAQKMGAFILEQLQYEWVINSPLPVLEFDIFGHSGLSTTRIDVAAQQAPAGAGGGTSPDDDGALMVLMQLVDGVEATRPSGSWPYLLPRKSGTANYSSALLISRERAPLAEKRAAVALEQLVLPDANVVRLEEEEHNPHDMIVFGDVQATAFSRQPQPRIGKVAAGNRAQFTVANHSVAAWTALDVQNPRNSGEIEAGTYTAPAASMFPLRQRLMNIKAQFANVQEGASKSALVVASSDDLVISPRVVIWATGDAPVRLTASQGGRLEWETDGDTFGSIVRDPADDNETPHAIFTPDAPPNHPPIRLQRIKVTNWEEESGYATVVILSMRAPRRMQPFYVPNMRASDSQTFTLTESLPGQASDETWGGRPAVLSTVWELYGKGEFVDGTYTAPESDPGEVSVVAGVYDGQAGIAVIEHDVHASLSDSIGSQRWKALNHFKLFLNDTSRKKAWANGRQQVAVDIHIETQPFNDSEGVPIYDPVSDAELATLQLTHRDGTPIQWLPADTEVIPPGGGSWAASKFRNRFDYLPAGEGLVSPNEAQEAQARKDQSKAVGVKGNEEALRIVTVYLQTTESEIRWIRAKFQNHENKTFYSYAQNTTDGEVELGGLVPKKLDVADLEPFTGKRVAQQAGFDIVDSNGRLVDGHNYWQYTTHYWALRARGQRSFVDVRFDHVSVLKYESELLDETFASYVGVAYVPRVLPGRTADRRIEYQAQMELLALQQAGTPLNREFATGEHFSAGTLLVSLERVSDMRFWYDQQDIRWREALSKPLYFTLIDNYGTQSALYINWGQQLDDGSIDSTDARNFLHWKFQ
ncbi:hypothetical protein JET76_27470 [Pseudomonas putida]|uniref:hypothetical protein n=1 Tax=Pseudomonas putida TaxID=303 RepID=UPI000DB69DCE|nr:hypothetical protein [Pseudomonas putida]MBI6945058.1 hypothetical protein [Pseudomonas putida]MBI6961409.1 hypothetical protein [Pseudomonas putida]PZQ39323.1 MAG: hypothetical protein DI560_14165 [Pseudomonas putida]